MDARYIQDDEKQTICRLIRAGTYPFTVLCKVGKEEGVAFVYSVDAEGLYWGTREPSEGARAWADAFLLENGGRYPV